MSCQDRALALSPGNAEILTNRGSALAELGRHHEALTCFREATAARPTYALAQLSEAMQLLRLGDFREGWKKYEWRWSTGGGRRPDLPEPLWLGNESIDGKTILLHAEEGLGNTIQFSRYAAAAAQRGATVILQVQSPLKTLLAGLPQVQVIASGDTLPAFHTHCPLMSLPHAFATDLDTIPPHTELYLPADLLSSWQSRLERIASPRVGLAWAGNANHPNDRHRSIPLPSLAPIFSAPGVQFIGLQKDLHDGDAEILASHPDVMHLGEQLADFADTAAAISQFDLVITVDTSVAHLAGSLGKPVWIMLPFAPDFRWMLDREDSPWYPTARLFRQTDNGDWATVVARILLELGGLAS